MQKFNTHKTPWALYFLANTSPSTKETEHVHKSMDFPSLPKQSCNTVDNLLILKVWCLKICRQSCWEWSHKLKSQYQQQSSTCDVWQHIGKCCGSLLLCSKYIQVTFDQQWLQLYSLQIQNNPLSLSGLEMLVVCNNIRKSTGKLTSILCTRLATLRNE